MHCLEAMASWVQARTTVSTREFATAVTNHKSIFFAENGVSKNPIDCVNAQLMRAE
jgi:hypothetical protein